MPINFEQLQPQILQSGISLGFQIQERNAQLQKAAKFFRDLASSSIDVERLSRVLNKKSEKRYAIPAEALIDGSHPADREIDQKITILAADGSQISPNRHEAVSFGLINTAIFIYRTHSTEIPSIVTETALIHPDPSSQYDDEFDENMIALQRDIAERKLLAKEACQLGCDNPVIALIDGPLQLFNLRQLFQNQKKLFEEYQSAIQQLSEKNIITAGYVDRPRADYVIRMIDFLKENPERNIQSGEPQFPLICDSDIFSLLLRPGERSSLFNLYSKNSMESKESMKIFFFYLNVGTIPKPMIARIEIPSWTAQNVESVNLLHACILEQTKIFGIYPYPYVLHRAHESALINFAEKNQITNLVAQELSRQEKSFFQKSNKQIMKDMSNRKISI